MEECCKVQTANKEEKGCCEACPDKGCDGCECSKPKNTTGCCGGCDCGNR